MSQRQRTRDSVLARLERQAVDLSRQGLGEGEYTGRGHLVNRATGERVSVPRWKIEDRWLTFECGCRAEWFDTLNDEKSWDPVVRGFDRLAVYDHVCHAHNASMNVRLMGHFVDFDQWRRHRRGKLTGTK